MYVFMCFILRYGIVLLLHYCTALCEALRTYMDLCPTANTILID